MVTSSLRKRDQGGRHDAWRRGDWPFEVVSSTIEAKRTDRRRGGLLDGGEDGNIHLFVLLLVGSDALRHEAYGHEGHSGNVTELHDGYSVEARYAASVSYVLSFELLFLDIEFA